MLWKYANFRNEKRKEKEEMFFTPWWVGFFMFASVLSSADAYSNNPPKFLIDGQTEIVVRLKEGDETPIGSLIYRLKGVDPDGDPLTFGVRDFPGNDILQIQRISGTEANIYLKKELDRETKDEYSLVLTLTDGRLGEGNFITQSMLILVEDVNDNEPVFKPYQSTISLPENSPPGIITSVEATDQDEGLYGQVVYQLQELDGDDDIFSISTVNGKGVIRLVGPLDYEKKYLYQLRVLATDRSNNDRINTGTAAILVKVEDVEDQPPEFLVVPPVTRIGEDAPIGSPVLRVKAVDGDRGVNNPIAYSITKGGQGIFDIDRNYGLVYTTQKLDRESPFNNNGAYILEITAVEVTKTTRPPPSVKTEVTVIVTDVNDETPTFRSEAYEAEVNENAQVNTPLTFLGNARPEVFDHDQGNNGTFHMFLEGDGGVFEVSPSIGINEATFLIRVKQPAILDYEKTHFLNFTLIAKETVPKNPKYSAVPFKVYVRDTNDNVPVFEHEVYEVSVKENAIKGTIVARVRASDEDSGNYGSSGIRYTSLGGSIAQMLTLDPITGIVSVEAEGPILDRELMSRHYLTVEARDDLGKGNRNTVQLIVNVDDVNDNPPIFLSSKYEARLIENSLNFETPLFIEAQDRDLNGTKNSEIRYTIIEGRELFKIDPVLGLILPAKRIDFEQLAKAQGFQPPNIPTRPITIVVKAEDLGVPSLSSQVQVFVHVLDVNDNAPVFEKPYYEASIPEDLSPGSTFLKTSAIDNDASSPNNEIIYRINKGPKDKFTIDSATGVISVAPGANLDPDQTQPKTTLYNLSIIASDGGIGSEQLQALTEVSIIIKDVNNKPPVFKDPGTIHIKENTNVGEYVYRLVATDPDENANLRYKIDPDNSEARNEDGTILKGTDYDYLGMLELSPADGMLRVRRLVDREKVEVVRLAVICEDLAAVGGKGSQITRSLLTIIVDDENDNSPQFRKPFYKRSITENSKTGDPIVSVVADDADKNRTIRYKLESTREVAQLVHLEEETGEVVVAGRIDHEQTAWLNFSIKATDSGEPPRSSMVEVFIQVLDENDNNPIFVGDVTYVTVSEDAEVGTEIGHIEARDADSGDFGKITYLLDRVSSGGKFQIHPDTGVLTVAGPLDREEQGSYMLVIEAWDNYHFGFSNGESRNAFKQIEVQVLDVNDETPVFEPKEGCATITEFHEEVITIIKASDNDAPLTPNSRILFHIIGGNDNNLFRLDHEGNGVAKLVAAAPLRGFFGNYSLLVEARDQGRPSRAATMTVPVCILDFNDHPPRITYPPQNATIRVPEDFTVGDAIIQVAAEDLDIGLNGAVRFRLKRDSAGAWRAFAINEESGVVTLRMPLDRERQKVYNLRVEAFDLGVPTPLSSDLEMVIYVKNVNDFQPQFTVDAFKVNFTEQQAPGTERTILAETIDRDEVEDLDDPPSQVCYFIVGGNEEGHFNLEPLRHELSVVKELDREKQAEHQLTVKATEDCLHTPANQTYNPLDNTLLNVEVRVLDINDHPPVFIKKIFTGGVTTNADFGTEFMQVKAIDEDEGENGVVHYYHIGKTKMTLTEGMDTIKAQPFLIDEKTGSIRLNFYPQKGMKGYFDLQVLANDTDGQQDTARVYIYLLREDQRVRFVLRQHPSEIRNKLDKFRDAVRNVTGAIVNVDEFKVHENKDGSVDNTKTDLFLHFVNKNDNSVIDVNHVLNIVDQNIENLDGVFKEFDVLDTQPAEASTLKGRPAGAQVLWLLGVIVFLGIMLVLVLSLCFSQRSRYKRAIKAATTAAFSTGQPDVNRTQVLPNTNKHSVEGSNPMWMKAYENEWYKEDESLSQSSDRDSLDNNAVVIEQRTSRIDSEQHSDKSDHTNSTYDSTANILPNSISSSVKEQNDLNRSQFHQNLYTSMGKIGNPLLHKKLETTEL